MAKMSAGPATVRAAAVVALAYLLLGELLPLPAARALLEGWAEQQVLLLALLSGLLTVLASCSSGSSFAAAPISAASLLAALNVGGLVVSLAPTPWFLVSDNCPVAPGAACDPLAIVLDVVGLVSARLARLDLGLCLVLASRGDSAWLLGATSGALGYAEAIPLHRTAGWWCAGMSALHSATYLLFYLETGGLRSLWVSCFPARTADGKLNRLGLVNFFGLVAAAALLALALPAQPTFRRRCYHVFQRLHLPVAAAFVVCCALHDLEILLFAVPGLASWYVERRTASSCRPRLLPATARLLPGTSGPWVELTVDCGAALPRASTPAPAPRGRWVSLRVAPLGHEWHPLSVTSSASGSGAELSAVVSARAGDWTRALADLCAPPAAARRFEVEVAGPYPFGGGAWSLSAEGGEQPALLLLAGGTGVTAWLPALSSARPAGRRCHLVWCVQDEADYLALAKRLPPEGGVRVTVHVTRAATGADGPLASSAADGEGAQASPPPPVRRRSSAWVQLVAALVGLVVGHWGWRGAAAALLLPKFPGDDDDGWLHQSVVGYTLSRRVLPIVLIVASMLLAAAASRCVSACAPSRRCYGYPAVTELARARQPQEPLFTDASSTAQPPPARAAPEEAQPADREGHDVRAGRPSFDALVRDAAQGLDAPRRLVVAACGPAALVNAARKAVAAARKECRGVRIEFAGGDSAW